MNRFMVMAVAVGMLAAGGCGAERDAAKEAPIDWPARAATVKVGMTRAEVENILPRWKSPTDFEKNQSQTIRGKQPLVTEKVDSGGGLPAKSLGTNTLILGQGYYSGGTYISLGSRGPGLITENYQVAEDWIVSVNYDDRDSKGSKGFSDENRLVTPVKIEKYVSPKTTSEDSDDQLNRSLAKRMAEEFMEYWQPDAQNYEKSGTAPFPRLGISKYYTVEFKPTNPAIKTPAAVLVDIEAAHVGWRHCDINDPSYKPGDILKKICTRQ